MFQKLIAEVTTSGIGRETLSTDDLVILELITMVKLSRKCDHTASFSLMMTAKPHLRANPVSCMFVKMRHDAHEDDRHAIVVDGVQSMTHFGLIKLAFELVQAGSSRPMHMIMCVSMSGDSARIASTVLKPNPNLLIFTDIRHDDDGEA